MEHTQIINKLSGMPEDMLKQVNDFIEFLLSRKRPSEEKKTRQFGSMRGLINIKPDFDDDIEGFEEYQ